MACGEFCLDDEFEYAKSDIIHYTRHTSLTKQYTLRLLVFSIIDRHSSIKRARSLCRRGLHIAGPFDRLMAWHRSVLLLRAISHITSTAMLSHAICLCAITSTIMVMFSVDKSSRKFSKIGSRLDAEFLFLNYVVLHTFTKQKSGGSIVNSDGNL